MPSAIFFLCDRQLVNFVFNSQLCLVCAQCSCALPWICMSSYGCRIRWPYLIWTARASRNCSYRGDLIKFRSLSMLLSASLWNVDKYWMAFEYIRLGAVAASSAINHMRSAWCTFTNTRFSRSLLIFFSSFYGKKPFNWCERAKKYSRRIGFNDGLPWHGSKRI